MEHSISSPSNRSWQAWSYVLLLTFLVGFVQFLTERWLLTEEVYIQSLSEKMPVKQLEQLLLIKADTEWLSIVIAVVSWGLGILFMGGWLTAGLSLFDYKLSWRGALDIALEAALIPIIAEVVKILWFGFSSTPFTLTDFRDTELISLQCFFTQAVDPDWLWAVLGYCNLFELGYCFLLVLGVQHYLTCSHRKAWGLIGLIYGSLLILILSGNIFLHSLY